MTKYFLNLIKQIKHIKYLSTNTMACSRYEYVKTFERDETIIPNVWIVIRIDGKGFHKFSKLHEFEKPNDVNALNLMNTAAISVMEEFRDIVIAFGQSDEYSFIFRKEANVFNRRTSKLLSYVTSLFTSSYVMNWSQLLPNCLLKYPPCFDGRIVVYPSDENLKDYLSWRQADVHVNNLYNTTFWCLVLQAGLTAQKAQEELSGTMSSHKNEMLFSRFNINYNNLPLMFRKGTILLRKRVLLENGQNRQLIIPSHDDMIGKSFWIENVEILGKGSGKVLNLIDNENLRISPLITRQLKELKIDKDCNKRENVMA